MLTATLPPSLEKELWERMWWSKVTVRLFRTRTSRSNIKYRTITISDRTKKIAAWTEIIIEAIVEHSGGRYVIYCNTRLVTKQLAEALGCEHFHQAPYEIGRSNGVFGRTKHQNEEYKGLIAQLLYCEKAVSLSVVINLP